MSDSTTSLLVATVASGRHGVKILIALTVVVAVVALLLYWGRGRRRKRGDHWDTQAPRLRWARRSPRS